MGSNVNLNPGHLQYHQPVSSGDEDEESSKDGSLRESAEIGDGDASNTDSVWGDDVTCAFTEALALYPPCGRRKIILSDEGKMYGRNELIARYIKIRTGKTRTRKQVSSHIQVLARRKARENQSKGKGVKNSGGPITSSLGPAQLASSVGLPSNIGGGHPSDGSGHHAAQLAAASLVAAHHHHSQSAVVAAAAAQVHHSAGHPTHLASHVANAAAGLAALGIGQNPYSTSQFWQPAGPTNEDIKPFIGDGKNFNGTSNNNNNNNNTATNYSNNSSSGTNGNSAAAANNLNNNNNNNNNSNNSKNAALLNGNSMVAWQGRSIASSKCRLIEFSAYADTGANSVDRHIFVQIGPHDSSLCNSALPPVYPLDLPMLEDIDIRQIFDKFPPNDGLKHLFLRGPASAFFLVKFWADLTIPPIIAEDSASPKSSCFYGIDMILEATESTVLTCTTSVCSFGRQVVQRVDTIECSPVSSSTSGPCNNANSPRNNNGNSSGNNSIFNSNCGSGNGNTRYIYRLGRTEMCEYMVNFILKLKDLPEKYMMNSVLENFTILQVISNKETGETLLCIAFVFEVSVSDNGAQHHTYRLVLPALPE